MTKNAIIAQSYNLAVEAGFNSYLEKHATRQNSEVKIDEDKLIKEIEDKWLNIVIAEIGNVTPKDYINSLISLEALIEFFIDIAAVSDIGVPDIVIDRLKEYGKPSADMLFDFVKASFDAKDQSKNLEISQAVYAIGCLRHEEYKEKLIKLLVECTDDMISEAICAAITEYEDTILEELFKTFNETDQEEVRENLLICVAEISREHPSDEIFLFFKNAFRVVSNIKIIAEVLGDYGDGRAIPMLRGYILKNMDSIDKDTFNLMRAVIKKLGGEIKDLVYKQV